MMSQKFERLLQRFQRLLSQHSAADWGALEGDEDNEDDDDYDTNEDVMNDFVGEENDLAWLVGKLLRLRVACNEARTCLRKVGELAGVPIEPPSQTQLANATLALPGVLCAGVPGAGGYDALYCIYIRGTPTTPHSDTVRDQIASTWRQWTPPPPKEQGQVQTNDDNDAITVVCPLAVRAAGSGPQDGICETTLDW
jgi:phosphomevalonate kinase